MDKETGVWQQVYRHSAFVVRREIAGETILVPVRGRLAQLHRLFVLNDMGVYLWDQLDGERRLDDILTGLLTTFEVARSEAERDLLDYVESLRDAELIVLDGEPSAASRPEQYGSEPAP